MTNEEKHALIEGCTQRVDALKNYCRFNPDDREASLDLSLCQIALVALTAQPVKLEPIIQIGYTHDEITCMCNIRNDDIRAIRAAGYEVQE